MFRRTLPVFLFLLLASFLLSGCGILGGENSHEINLKFAGQQQRGIANITLSVADFRMVVSCVSGESMTVSTPTFTLIGEDLEGCKARLVEFTLASGKHYVYQSGFVDWTFPEVGKYQSDQGETLLVQIITQIPDPITDSISVEYRVGSLTNGGDLELDIIGASGSFTLSAADAIAFDLRTPVYLGDGTSFAFPLECQATIEGDSVENARCSGAGVGPMQFSVSSYQNEEVSLELLQGLLDVAPTLAELESQTAGGIIVPDPAYLPNGGVYAVDRLNIPLSGGSVRYLIAMRSVSAQGIAYRYWIFTLNVNAPSGGNDGAPGTLDVSFADDGVFRTDFGAKLAIPYNFSLQTDGKLVIPGTEYLNGNLDTYDLMVARYNLDGSPDLDFGTDGRAITHFDSHSSATGSAVHDNGNIVVAGYVMDDVNGYYAVLVGYTPTGDLNQGFGNGGILVPPDIGFLYSPVIQGDEKILAIGSSTSVYRFLPDGSPDMGFGTNGSVDLDAIVSELRLSWQDRLVVQTDGKILIAGSSWNGVDYDMSLVRINSDGSLDSSFAGTGWMIYHRENDIGQAVTLDSDGNIYLTGRTYGDSPYGFLIIKMNSDGIVDTRLGNNGIVFVGGVGGARSVAVQSDGKILVGNSYGVIRLDTDGNLDGIFGQGGVSEYGAWGDWIIIRGDGKIYAGGLAHGGGSFGLYHR